MSDYTHVISVSLTPRDAQAAAELRVALDVLCAADPGLGFEVGSANQVIVKGQTERQLEFAVDRAQRAFKIDFDIGAPQIAYRETITRIAETDYTHKEQSGGSGQFARIKIRWEPLARGSGSVFENAIVGDTIPKAFIPAVQKGLTSAKDTGVLAGFLCTDFKAVLFGGAFHDIDSNSLAFEIAARRAFREGMAKAGPTLLEPVMRLEVVTPEDYMGDIIGDLNQRRATINGIDSRNSARIITALVPLASLFGYVNALSTMTLGGRAQHTMRFDHYEQVPPTWPDGDDNYPMSAVL